MRICVAAYFLKKSQPKEITASTKNNHRQTKKLKTVTVYFSFAHRLMCICGEKVISFDRWTNKNIKKLPFFYLCRFVDSIVGK
jgi:hypothetical protein